MDKVVGLIGIGLVGTALAERLRAAGFDVVGFDIDPERCAALAALGGTVAVSANDVADRCDRVLLALVEPTVTQDVVEDMATHLKSGAIVIDTGTGDPLRIEMLARRLLARGIETIDAPLSGSSEQIRRGDAVAMLGGSEAAIAACAELWQVLAARHVHVGPVGSGQRAKLATNLVLGLNRAALAEGIAFAEAQGLDPAAFVELVRITPAYSRAVDVKGERMLARRYDPESRIAQHRKDVALMLSAATAAGIALPLSQAHAALLDAAIAAGDGQLDNAAIVEVWRRSRAPSPSTS
jgi:3-hydroxyisobutyrate dehydrogenase-like beta-hydroxyacid dehydrogenase